jgi:SAM-dependent methyltransferase
MKRFPPHLAAVLVLCFAWACAAEDKSSPKDQQQDPSQKEQREQKQQTEPAEHAYEYRPGSPDGIGKWYMGREIAHVMGHEGAGWLERPEREKEEQPSKLIEILKKRIKPADVFADIGAGTGYYSFRIAPLVPKGKVLAVDIQQEMLDLLTAASEKKGVKNVEPVLGTVEDPNLPADAVDYALLVDAYHEFDHPREMMRAIYKALKPGGKVLLVEFRGEDPNVPIKALHKMSEAQAKKEMTAAGLKHVETIKELPWQHVMVFEKPVE